MLGGFEAGILEDVGGGQSLGTNCKVEVLFTVLCSCSVASVMSDCMLPYGL